MPARLTLTARAADLSGASQLVLLGRKERLLRPDAAAASTLAPSLWEQMVRSAEARNAGRAVGTFREGAPERVTAAVLPETCSRHNSPSRAWAVPGLLQGKVGKGRAAVVALLEDRAHALPVTLAVARALPTFSASSSASEGEVQLLLLGPDGAPVDDVATLGAAADAVRFAADLVDQPPDRLTTTRFVEIAREVAARHDGVQLTVIQGEELAEQGLGGLHGVGRASEHPPALVVLDLPAPDDAPRLAWVGKGIVYDTGGLSIKAKSSMPGMKTDMGGAAAVLAAFDAAARLRAPVRLTAALCIAENAVGPRALRNDDILTMYSGRTVEVNNTDAEGRLVLADGAAWVARHRDPATLVDIATLTGAQPMATGQRTAALYCNDDGLEAEAVAAGRSSGDLVHPLPYVPEFFKREFASHVADMRNSVKDRSNAQSSCAGQFIGDHLEAVGFGGRWLHVDIAGPAVHAGRGTGFGVGLLLALAGVRPS